MAKMTIAAEIAALVAAGDQMVASNKFQTADGTPLLVRSMESTNDPLEVGDIISIPAEYTVLDTAFSDAADAPRYSYFLAEVRSADGSERNFRFFPNSLCKTCVPIDEQGKRLAKVKTSGTASDLFRSKPTVDEGLALLAGKKIKVAAAEAYKTYEYGKQTTKTTHIYQYDLID